MFIGNFKTFFFLSVNISAEYTNLRLTLRATMTINSMVSKDVIAVRTSD